MLTHDEILEQVMALSLQERQTLTKLLIDALASSISVPLDQQQAASKTAGRGDSLSRNEGPRKSISFRLQVSIIKQLEDTYHQFKLAGIRIRQADLREDIIKLGLEHVDELRGRYQDTSLGPQT